MAKKTSNVQQQERWLCRLRLKEDLIWIKAAAFRCSETLNGEEVIVAVTARLGVYVWTLSSINTFVDSFDKSTNTELPIELDEKKATVYFSLCDCHNVSGREPCLCMRGGPRREDEHCIPDFRTVFFSPNKSYIVIQDDCKIRRGNTCIHSAENGTLLVHFSPSSQVCFKSFFPVDSRVLVCDNNRTNMYICDIGTNVLTTSTTPTDITHRSAEPLSVLKPSNDLLRPGMMQHTNTADWHISQFGLTCDGCVAYAHWGYMDIDDVVMNTRCLTTHHGNVLLWETKLGSPLGHIYERDNMSIVSVHVAFVYLPVKNAEHCVALTISDCGTVRLWDVGPRSFVMMHTTSNGGDGGCDSGSGCATKRYKTAELGCFQQHSGMCRDIVQTQCYLHDNTHLRMLYIDPTHHILYIHDLTEFLHNITAKETSSSTTSSEMIPTASNILIQCDLKIYGIRAEDITALQITVNTCNPSAIAMMTMHEKLLVLGDDTDHHVLLTYQPHCKKQSSCSNIDFNLDHDLMLTCADTDFYINVWLMEEQVPSK